MEEHNESEVLDKLCSNQFPFPKYLDPCAGRVFCVENFSNPFLDDCDGITRTASVGTGCFVLACGLILNVLCIIVLNRMNMNAEVLFLMKCLAVYDFLLLLGAFFTFEAEYFRWIFGFGYNKHTAYLYVERVSYYCLYRLNGSMSFWTLAVLTVQR